MKIVITGGHLTPALALIDYIQTQHPSDEIVFCGRLYSQEKEKQPSHEVDEVSRRGIKFVPLNAPRLSHLQQWWNLPIIGIRLVGSVLKSLGIVLRYRPQVFVSFGGYVALPMAIACWLCWVPIVTHEQTRSAGSANRFISRLARKVAISYPESLRFFAAKKTVVTGNPLRQQLFITQPKPDWLPASISRPVLYVTGGNQGSAIINHIVQQSLKQLTKHWLVVHQCGAPTAKQHYLADLTKAKQQLSAAGRENYIVREWITEAELGWLYQHVTAVVSRAGANTISELTAQQVPAVLIPLPFAHYDEQTMNAEVLAKAGGAVVIPQRELTTKTLLTALDKIQRYRRSMSSKLKSLPVTQDADAKLYQVVQDVVSPA